MVNSFLWLFVYMAAMLIIMLVVFVLEVIFYGEVIIAQVLYLALGPFCFLLTILGPQTRLDRQECLKKTERGTLEKELKKLGVSDVRYETSSKKKILRGTINESTYFMIEEGAGEDPNYSDNIVIITDGVEFDAAEEGTRFWVYDYDYYVSSDGAIILKYDQIDYIKELKVGGKVGELRDDKNVKD